MSLHDKVLIVTGGTSGIGEACSRHFAALGARVVIASNQAAPGAALDDALAIACGDGAIRLLQIQRAGKQPKMNADKAKQRCEELEARLENRLALLDLQMQFSSEMPVVESGAYVVPKVLLERLFAERRGELPPQRPSQEEIERIDKLAISAVLAAEHALGRQPREMPHNNPGYDIESFVLDAHGNPTGEIVFIEVKGKTVGVAEVTVSANQIRQSLNAPERFVLAIVPIEDGKALQPRYVRRPYRNNIDHTVQSMSLKVSELLAISKDPA